MRLADFGQRDAAIFFIKFVILRVQLPDQTGHAAVPLHVLRGRPRDDQRGTRLVDEDVVHLVDDGVMMAALHAAGQVHHQVITQEVKTEFVVGAICDIRRVSPGARHQAQLVQLFARVPRCQIHQESALGVIRAAGHLQHAHAQTQQVINGRHPARVAPCQVVVHRHQVRAFTAERVEVERQSGHQRLALTGAHLGDLAAVQHHTPNQLHVIMTQAGGALAGLADRGKCLRQDLIQGFTVPQAPAEFIRFGAQIRVAEPLIRRFQLIDRFDLSHQARQFALLRVAAQGASDVFEHSLTFRQRL